jgi:hypothetical protein
VQTTKNTRPPPPPHIVFFFEEAAVVVVRRQRRRQRWCKNQKIPRTGALNCCERGVRSAPRYDAARKIIDEGCFRVLLFKVELYPNI